jgi:ubiquinone biosynthesis protein COQ4
MQTTLERPAINDKFAESLLATFNGQHEVYMLFNEWWAAASDEAISKYAADFSQLPEQKAFLEAHYFAPQVELEQLIKLPKGTIGRDYHDFIVDNGLEKNIAVNYSQLHDFMSASGQLDRMPVELRYAIIRAFQVHDMMHVLTGYKATPTDEIALQAFCLAQIRFPYFGMWMSVVTTQMTMINPDMIVPMMDAISDGWRRGRSAKNIQFTQWETLYSERTEDMQRRFGLI